MIFAKKEKVITKFTLSCHKVDFFHISHIELLEDSDGSSVFETAFECQIMNLLICEIQTQLV